MIHFFTEADLDTYRAEGDPVLSLLGDERARGAESERWLAESEAKRMIAWRVYGPLLCPKTPRFRVLDIGSGLSSLSFALAARHDYMVCDLVAVGLDQLQPPWVWGDWAKIPSAGYDLVIAVDLFPNVDQRLSEFLRKFSGYSLRVVLTTYEDRWYLTRRVDANELLTVKMWDWKTTARAIGVEHRSGHCSGPPTKSLFPNGRQVCLYTT